ncbi:MAG: hypothetical protein ACRDT6_07070 [Micromonosporaceae bacterium]
MELQVLRRSDAGTRVGVAGQVRLTAYQLERARLVLALHRRHGLLTWRCGRCRGRYPCPDVYDAIVTLRRAGLR